MQTAASKCKSSPKFQGYLGYLAPLDSWNSKYRSISHTAFCTSTFPMGFKDYIYGSFCLVVLHRQITNHKIPSLEWERSVYLYNYKSKYNTILLHNMYNVFYNYMFRPILGHLQAYVLKWDVVVKYTAHVVQSNCVVSTDNYTNILIHRTQRGCHTY